MQQFNTSELKDIPFSIGLMAMSDINGKQSLPQVQENFMKTAVEIGVHLHFQETFSKNQRIEEVLKAFIKCHKLMDYLIKAKQKSEITRDEYLHFEIQMKDVIKRLELAYEKMTNPTIGFNC